MESSPSPFIPFNGQIRDVLYGYIDFVKGFEDKVIDSWAMQRLRYVYQLQAAHFIYPNATHTRFAHSIGVMHSSFKYITHLLRTSNHLPEESFFRRDIFGRQKELIFAARLLGLMHDLGHGPFSHAFDKYVYKTREFLGYSVGNHEVVGYLIYRDFLRDKIFEQALDSAKTLGLDPEVLISLLDEGMKPPKGMKDFTDLVNRSLLSDKDFYTISFNDLSSMVRLVVRDYVYTSDIMDYLKRDSFFTGVPVGEINDDWIIRNTFLVEKDSMIIPGVTRKSLDEIARLFDARKIMYKNVYLHPVNVAFIEMIGYLLQCLKSRLVDIIEGMLQKPENLSKYFLLTDHSLYSMLVNLMYEDVSTYECIDKDLARKALQSLFIERKPVWKMIGRFNYNLERAKHLFGGRFAETYQKTLKEKISEEISSALKSRNIDSNDILTIIDKVEIYPSSGSEVLDKIHVVEIRNGKVIDVDELTYKDFAQQHGLIPEALFTIYVNREKYKDLSSNDLKKAQETAEEVIKEALYGGGREAPETS
uniref:HD domain-containing protein n=1 Tax=Thermosphaera aggregans TaxID=54254 RepID=A0A7C2FCH1_9CREN